MPWCPNCKNEYRDGITTCVDCNIPLVDSLDEVTKETTELAVEKEKVVAIRLVKYLRFSGITSATINVDATERCYRILVELDNKKDAMKHYKAFQIVESEKALNQNVELESDDIDEEFKNLEDFTPEDPDFTEEAGDIEDAADEVDSEETKTSVSKPSKGLYAKKEDAYRENRSSGIMFLTFSIVGLIFVALNATKVITFINGLLSYTVLTAMFLSFFFLGIYSLKRAKEASGHIDAERELTNNITAYFDSFGDITNIDEPDWSDLNDELLYFKRTNLLKRMVIEKFGEQNEDYLDCIIEEYYNSHVS